MEYPMQRFTTRIILVATLFLFSLSSWAISNRLYSEMLDARAEVFLTPKEHFESMQKATAVLVGCELDELCAMIALKHMSTNEDNLFYIHFYNKLLKRRDDIMYNTMKCQNPRINEMRKTLASCIHVFKDPLSLTFEPEAIAKINHGLKQCSLKKLSKLAKQKGNVFAQGKMLEYELSRANVKGINYWYNKMVEFYPTKQYHVYNKCVDDL